MSADTGDKVTRLYSNFRGVDFRGEEINLARSPDSLNVWKDYKETQGIRTRPGMEPAAMFDKIVHGIFFYKEAMLVHSGTKLYKITKAYDPIKEQMSFANGEKTELCSDLQEMPSNGFVFENVFYFKDGKHYLMYNGTSVAEVEGYVPTTSIGCKPEGGGTKHEDVNMLTGKRINAFLADGISFDYYLDAQNVDADFTPIVTVNGEPETNFTFYPTAGKISFKEAPITTYTDGRDNVSVTFSKTVPGYKENILNATLLQVFDNRVFFSGNPDYPNYVWHCSLNNPAYCSDLDYYQEGMDSAKVMGMVAGNNALWVFREPSEANTNVFYHTPTIDDAYGKVYPSVHSSVSIGCVGKAINFNDDIVFFSERGMEGISGDVTTEQVAAHRSTMVDRKLTAEEGYKNMVLAEWEGYLFVFTGSKAYLADSRAMLTNENHAEYEWFYWELDKDVFCAAVQDSVLYLGTTESVYTLTDTKANMESYWITPKDKFSAPSKLKTTNKRGCVAEATGDITVFAKTENTEFEEIGTYKNVTDYFVSRIKQKKFKDIQLKFYSDTRFSLETVTLECFVGGYIKR